MAYSGRMGGSHHAHNGGGGNFLCMPEEDPEYLIYTPGIGDLSYVFGTEIYSPGTGSPFHRLSRDNVPCSLCYTPSRTTIAMIPAKITCPTGWRKEYAGYIMTGYHGAAGSRTTFECIDEDAEAVPGLGVANHASVLHFVEAHCNGMPCPPYDPEKELTCVVCTK